MLSSFGAAKRKKKYCNSLKSVYSILNIKCITLKSYPKRKYVLVGDSAENDAEIYAHIYHQYPQNIHKILIRCASTTEAVCVQKVQNAITNYNVPSNVMDYFANDSSDIQQKIFGY